jgi:hypothetical protein
LLGKNLAQPDKSLAREIDRLMPTILAMKEKRIPPNEIASACRLTEATVLGVLDKLKAADTGKRAPQL